jgi:hypothetical protein
LDGSLVFEKGFYWLDFFRRWPSRCVTSPIVLGTEFTNYVQENGTLIFPPYTVVEKINPFSDGFTFVQFPGEVKLVDRRKGTRTLLPNGSSARLLPFARYAILSMQKEGTTRKYLINAIGEQLFELKEDSNLNNVHEFGENKLLLTYETYNGGQGSNTKTFSIIQKEQP